MNGAPAKPPNFALLIGKRLAGKKGEPPPDEGDDYGEGGGEHKEMELSAMKDLIAAIHAKSPEAACQAMDDYMQLADTDEEEEPPADEEAPPPEE